MQFILLISYNMFIKSFDQTNEGNFVNKFSCLQIRNFRSGHFFFVPMKMILWNVCKKISSVPITDMQTPLPHSEMAIFAWKLRNVLKKRMKNIFSDYYFLSYGRFYTQNSQKPMSFDLNNWPNFFLSEKLRNVLKQVQNQISDFGIWSIFCSTFLVYWRLRQLCALTVWKSDSEALNSDTR